MPKQVDKSHYKFQSYLGKARWGSIWHQLDEVINLAPDSVLEIGPGPGTFKANARALGINVATLDIDPELNPDYLASVVKIPIDDSSFDVVCAFQVLEHLEWKDSKRAFQEMVRVARNAIIISLPDAGTRRLLSIDIPKLGRYCFQIPLPWSRYRRHRFDGQHYWELNKAGFSVTQVLNEFLSLPHMSLSKTYKVPELPNHRFFVFVKTG